ncbi:MAG: GLPGLI family protein [Sphingobacteriales bacterium]|jgi:GLPGLI family protein
MKSFLTLLLTVFTLNGFAQNLEGKINYEIKRTMNFDDSRFSEMPKDMRDRIKERMEKMGNAKKVLEFNRAATVYRAYDPAKDAKDDSEWEDNADGGRGWRMMGAKTITHYSVEKSVITEQREFMDKQFLIKDESRGDGWKLTGKMEAILGYPCQEATTMMNDTVPVVAWFCPSIPVSSGPEGYNGLPGMILKLDYNNSELIAEAITLEDIKINADDLEQPNKGKKVTREEFTAIVKEKTDEMRKMGGGGFRR